MLASWSNSVLEPTTWCIRWAVSPGPLTLTINTDLAELGPADRHTPIRRSDHPEAHASAVICASFPAADR
jgi:hypothetical protein